MSTNTTALPPSIHRVLGKWRRNLRECIPYIKIKEKGFYEGMACNYFFPLFVGYAVAKRLRTKLLTFYLKE